MSPEQLFGPLNALALLSWLLLAVFPARPLITRIVAGTAVPAFLAVAYVVMIASAWGGSEGGFSSLDGVAALFANRWLLLAGWTHYLAFDLFIGGWEVRDAQARGVPHLLVVPALVLTFLAGPAGLLLYLAIRAVARPKAVHRPS